MSDTHRCNTAGGCQGREVQVHRHARRKAHTHRGTHTESAHSGTCLAYTGVHKGQRLLPDPLTSSSTLCTWSQACHSSRLRPTQWVASCTVQGREGTGNQAGGCVIWREATGGTCVITVPTRLRDERGLLDGSRWARLERKLSCWGTAMLRRAPAAPPETSLARI